ncbi:hypothetical protein TUM20249_38370 [Pseudomonas tohonis]|nr:hypothetical protein TUM20249_38370 [Pseudomonas tohonis]
MYQPDLTLTYKKRAAGSAGVIDRNERHLGAQSKQPDRMSAMNLKNMAVLPSDQAHYFPYIGADPCNVSTGFRAHVNSSMHPFKFALADQPSYCLGYGATRSKLRKAADAEGLPFG